MVKLVSRKKIGFRNPETKEILTANPHEFISFPDWVKKDPLYEWAKEDGTIEVVGDDAASAAPPANEKPTKATSKKE